MIKRIPEIIKVHLKAPKTRIKIISIIGLIIFSICLILLQTSFAGITPVRSITITSENLSYENNEPGSWKITKSAKWISRGKARITFNVESQIKPSKDYTDVILVLDTSGSMNGERLDKVKTDTTNLINEMIPKGSNIALITFNDTSSIITDFTNDTTLLQESVNNLTATGETNYYQALVNVDTILNNYQKLDNRDCVVLFLTDGLPTIDTPNEVSQYKYLKSTYQFLTINGIQYEMGEEPLDGVKNISDNQYIADMDTLDKFLYRAALSPASYTNFELTDYIYSDYFNVSDVSSIIASTGTVSLENEEGTPKVIWNLNGLTSGTEAELTIDINLNEDLIDVGGVYPTNENISVNYKIGKTSVQETSELTPILADNYVVQYEANAPDTCTVSNMPESKNASVFDTVKIDTDTKPICEGYKFKEWQLVTEDVTQVNADYFIMPEENITIRATWSKLASTKSMEGEMFVIPTLYQLIADNSVLDTDVDFSASSTTGIYTLESTANDSYPVHYYRGDVTNNNVLFANFCWKIVRTTSTGGVKLIYNGEPNGNGGCTATGEDTQIGKSIFNPNNFSPADLGYMNDTKYFHGVKERVSINVLNKTSTSSTSEYYYGNAIKVNEDGTYTLQNAETKIWSDNYNALVGYYTCRKTIDEVCTTVYYIAGSTSNYQYDIALTGGAVLDEQKIILAASKTNNEDGTYTLVEPIEILKKDWFTNYSTYKNYYMCSDLTSTTCSPMSFILSTYDHKIEADESIGYIYGNDVEWDGTTYTLLDTIKSNGGWSTELTDLATKYHYTCLNTTGKCTSVKYIYYFGSGAKYDIYYLSLTDVENIEAAKDAMFTNDENSTSSRIKLKIDDWYATNMTEYTDKLEDTVWCNDRTLYSGTLKSKDTSSTGFPYFGAQGRVYDEPSVICPEIRDSFTTSTSTGNGLLTYPVGLLTADEIKLAGGNDNTYYLYTGQYWWTLTPQNFHYAGSYGFYVRSNGKLGSSFVNTLSGIRPSISLKTGTRSVDGDGSPEEPFIVE